MPPKKGGKKTKRGKKAPGADEGNRYTPFAEDGQMYAIATKMLGNRRLIAKCTDEQERLAIIPGKYKGKRNWISVGMVLLLGIRDYQDDKADVIYIYNDQDVKRIRRTGVLDSLIDEEKEDCGFVFGEPNEENEGRESPVLEIDLDDL